MKKITILITFFTVLFVACKSEKKIKKEEIIVKKEKVFSLLSAQKKIQWTAFKTTEKIPVKGVFNKVIIDKNGNGNTIKEAVNNTKFSIPISSIFSGNEERDSKLLKMFFGVMNNPKLLTGELIIIDDLSGVATINMNGVTEKLIFNYLIKDNRFELKAVLDLKKWKAEKAINSLNKACFDLHKGKDGISKTWSEVEILITISF